MKKSEARRANLLKLIFNPHNEAATPQDRIFAEMTVELCRTIEESTTRIIEEMRKKRRK